MARMGPHVTDDDLAARLRALARHRSILGAPGFSFGEWVDAGRNADGTLSLGWYRLSDAAEAFVRDVGGAGWIVPFDWPAWMATAEAQALVTDHARIAGASVEELSRLLTAIVRSDRFTEGSMAGAFESGLIGAILERAEALAGEFEPAREGPAATT